MKTDINPDNKSTKMVPRKLRNISRDRMFRVLFISILLALAMGSLRPDKPTGLHPNRYWAIKSNWRGCADIVLAGDSRVVQGVSPEEMKKTFPNNRILNYGFYGTGYSRDYLKAVEKVLDPRSPDKVVILGISANSVSSSAFEKNCFTEVFGNTERNSFVNTHLSGLVSFFEPMSFRDAMHGLFPSLKRSHTYLEFFADGWVACRREPERKKHELRRYRTIFQEHNFSSEIEKNILEFVSRWAVVGIRVYGFRPPSCAEMLELEDELSGFNQTAFANAFNAAGGRWLEVNQFGYHTFDGSHLRRDGAVRFSGDLAEMLSNIKTGYSMKPPN